MIIGPKSIGKNSYQISGNILNGYNKSNANAACIPFGINIIGNKTFENCQNLKTILLPETVVTIGDEAFQGCNHLKNINIPASVKTIGENAFDGCENLKRLYIPDSVDNCQLLGKISLDYLRIPIKLWNRGIFCGDLTPELRIKHLALGLPDTEMSNGSLVEINNKLFGYFDTCPFISFEVPTSNYSANISGGYETYNGCVLNYSSYETDSSEEFWGVALIIPDECLTVPSKVEVLDCHCVGESRSLPLYIPDTVQYIHPNAFELWHKPILITAKHNYIHLEEILPSANKSADSLSDIIIYVI